MKALLMSVIVALLISCSTNGQTQEQKSESDKNAMMNNQEIINVAFFYLKDGQESEFEKIKIKR